MQTKQYKAGEHPDLASFLATEEFNGSDLMTVKLAYMCLCYGLLKENIAPAGSSYKNKYSLTTKGKYYIKKHKATNK